MGDTMYTNLTIGIVGLGTRGRVQARSICELGADVVGTDVDRTARQAFEREFDTVTYETPTAMCEADVDGVVVTTPSKFHRVPACTALEFGYDVLIEKPLAHTVESAEQITDTAADSEGRCLVGFHNRCWDAVSALKGYIDEGHFGEVTHVQAEYLRRRGVPSRGSWYTSKKISGGGVLVDIGIHAIDLAFFFTEFPETWDAHGVMRQEFGNRSDYTYLDMWGEETESGVESGMFDVEDSASALVEYGDDRSLGLEIAWATNASPRHRYRIHGTEAGAELSLTPDGTEADVTIYRTSSVGSDHFRNTELLTRESGPVLNEFRYFCDVLRDGTRTDLATGEEALTTQRVIEDLYADCGR